MEWYLGLVKRKLDDYRAADRVEVSDWNVGAGKVKYWRMDSLDGMGNTACVWQGKDKIKLRRRS